MLLAFDSAAQDGMDRLTTWIARRSSDTVSCWHAFRRTELDWIDARKTVWWGRMKAAPLEVNIWRSVGDLSHNLEGLGPRG